MLTRRIIPCLDVRGDEVVKGVRFRRLRSVGAPVDLAARYARDGADELCFLDVSASINDEPPMLGLIERISRVLFIPFTVGGGIRTTATARALLRAGADKVAVNTAALLRPALLGELAEEFGRQCVVLSIDTCELDRVWRVTTHGGGRALEKTCLDWAREGTERGAGEILLNVIDADGEREGFSLEITRQIAAAVTVPVIASGGAGSPEHFDDLFRHTEASAGLAASIFHDGSYKPKDLKTFLRARGMEVRL